MIPVLGLDGCKAGWFYFRRDGDAITHGIAPNLATLAASLPDRARVFIDIPIGLVESGSAGRACDTTARRLLGAKRASSVFPAPCRAVLNAQDYQEAKQLSTAAIGKKLSKQAFNITPKIREVDAFLRQNPKICVREVHPEICFWALNGRQTVAARKKEHAGFAARLALLEPYIPNLHQLVDAVLSSYPRKHVLKDDILDALVVLVVAGTSDDALQTLPACPPKDNCGLPMEIVYTEAPNAHAIKA